MNSDRFEPSTPTNKYQEQFDQDGHISMGDATTRRPKLY